MIYRNGIYYDRMIRNSRLHDQMIRNGVTYGLSNDPPSPESFRQVRKDANPSVYGFYEYLPGNYNNQSEVPLLIFLTGSGEAGNGNSQLNRVLTWGIPKQCNAGTWHHNFIMLAPQWMSESQAEAYDASLMKDFIDYAKQEYKVDSSRIYITGMSAGGWYTLFYLQNYPTTHGVAAATLLSTTIEDGYTDAAAIAASNCPQWWLSNIGDGDVPWQNDIPEWGYKSVINSVAAINAANPGLVERLTGFNNSTHTGTWDGVYDGSLIGTANVNYDPFDEPIYDWLMSHTL